MTLPDSLPAQLFLLACDRKKQRLVSRSELGYALRAAALADLVLGGHLADDGGKAVPASPAPGLDPVLEELLLEIGAAPPRPWRRWVRSRRSRMVPAVRDRLVAAHVVKVDTHRPLGLFPVHRIDVRRPQDARRLLEDVRRAARSGHPAARVDPRVGALTAIAGTAELGTVFSRAERRRYRARFAELGRPVSPVVAALRKAIQSQRAVVATTSGGG